MKWVGLFILLVVIFALVKNYRHKMTMSGWKWSWGWIGWSALGIYALIVVGPWVLPFVLYDMPKTSVQNAHAWRTGNSAAASTQSAQEPEWDENELREIHFLSAAKKLGWKDLPICKDIYVPLDNQERSTGINLAFMEGSQLITTCPDYIKNNPVRVEMRENQLNWKDVYEREKLLNILPGGQTSGAPTIRGAFIGNRHEARFNPNPICINVNAIKVPGHVRIAMYKDCDPGKKCRCTILRIGKSKIPWKFYVRFADPDTGMTLAEETMHNNSGLLIVGAMSNEEDGDAIDIIFHREVSLAENTYGGYVAGEAANPMLFIRPPAYKKKVRVEVVLDFDKTRRRN